MQEVFSTNVDNQEAVDIVVYEGERQLTKDNNRLGQFTLAGIPPMPRNVPQIEVTFDVNSDGILSVYATELSTGAKANITITHDKMNLSSLDIERMVKEAEASHAADSAERAKVRKPLATLAAAPGRWWCQDVVAAWWGAWTVM